MTFTRLTVEIWPESVSECHLEPCDGDEVCPTFPGEHSRHGGVVQAGLAGNVSEAPASDGGAEVLGELVGVMHLGWAFDAPIRPLAFNQVGAGRSIESGSAGHVATLTQIPSWNATSPPVWCFHAPTRCGHPGGERSLRWSYDP